jgi:hypothetical protein
LEGSGEIIVLDGQQRLTSLLHALTSTGDGHYYIHLSAMSSGNVEDLEEGLGFSADLPAPPLSTAGDIVIPLEVLGSRKAFFSWRDHELQLSDVDLKYQLSQAYRDHLHWLHDHEFPVVMLDPSVDDSSVARIFERVNRTGMRLGSFDLVVARAYRADWNLRNLWAEARLEYPLLDHFLEDDGLPVLQAISLVSERNVRQSAVLDLDPKLVSARWTESVEAVNSAVKFLAEQCGVVRAEWLPYRAFILILAALELDALLAGHADSLRRYVLSRSFALRFDVAANTRVVEDYRMLLEVFEGGDLPYIPRVTNEILAGTTRQKRGALWRAFFCALALNDAKDPFDSLLRLSTLPLHDSGDLEVPEARPTPLVKRSDEGAHLLALVTALCSPDSARQIRRMVSAERIQQGEFDEAALRSQFLPPADELAAYMQDAVKLAYFRLEKLDYWLDQKGITRQGVGRQ